MATKLSAHRSCIVALLWGLILCSSGELRSESRPGYGKILTASMTGESVEIDPLMGKSPEDIELANLLFDALYRIEGGEVVPNLAAEMPDRSNPFLVKIRLRPGLRFHDGSRVKPADVVYSLRRINQSSSSPFDSSVKSIDEVDGEIHISLRRSLPHVAQRLTAVQTAITKGGRAPSWGRCIGTGPFRLKGKNSQNTSIELVTFAGHWRGRSYLDGLKLRWFEGAKKEAMAFERGSMQLSRRGAIAFAGHRPKYKSRSFAAEARLLVYLGFGRRQAILSEQGFRRALSHAIDRQGMKHIGYGEAIVPTRTPDAKARRKTAMGANKGLAGRELLTLASRYSDIEASRLQLELLVNASRPEDIDVAGRIAGALYSFGIGVKIQSLPAQIFRKRVDKGDCELYVGQLAQSSSNELQQYRQSFLLPGATQSVPTKLRTIAQLEAFFRKTQPILPLFYKGQKIHTRSDLWETRFDEGQRPRFETMYFDGPIREN